MLFKVVVVLGVIFFWGGGVYSYYLYSDIQILKDIHIVSKTDERF